MHARRRSVSALPYPSAPLHQKPPRRNESRTPGVPLTTGIAVLAAFATLILPASSPAGGPAGLLPDSRDPAAWHPADEDTFRSAADETTKAHEKPEDWDVAAPHGPADTLRFETSEGTWVSVDVSPDGATIVFDLLGDLYTVPIAGGEAKRITGGPAYDFQPRWSPDGKRIAMTSDRGGTDNIWTIDPDGGRPRAITKEKDRVTNSASWSPDGDYVIARRRLTDRSSIGTVELWMIHTKGGSGIQITTKEEIPDANEPVFSPDGRFLYFAARNARYQYNRNVYEGIWQIRRYDRVTGQLQTITGEPGGAGRPAISPDGKTLAFIRRVREKTVLHLHDLASGAQRPLWDGLSGDMQENFAWTGVYPGTAWTPDGRAIVLWAKGKLWRVDRATGAAAEIPFRAQVEQVVTKALRFPQAIGTDSLTVRMLGWPTRAPDGRSLVFTALGDLWSMDVATKRVRRLPTEGGLAYSPAFSPDGRALAYVSWSDREGGHLWRMPASGGRSTRLTSMPSQYANPSFSSDGTKIVFLKGSGSVYRQGGLDDELWFEIHWLPAAGGEPVFITSTGNRGAARRMPRPVWSPGGDRVFYAEDETAGLETKAVLVSVKTDGTDRKVHLRFKYADDVIPSPDGKWVAYSWLYNAWVAALPLGGKMPLEINAEDPAVPARQLTKDGGEWIQWADRGKSVTWSWGPAFYRLPMDSLFAAWERAQEKKPAGPGKSSGGNDSGGRNSGGKNPGGMGGEPGKSAKNADDGVHPDTLEVRLVVPRAKPSGTFALTNARVITMKGDEVLEGATVLVKDNRIAAVGPAGSVPVPAGARLFDVSGKTVLPGLVDVHAHYNYATLDILPEAEWSHFANLAYGVTTAHDPSASSYEVFTEGERIEAGRMTGPRTFSTGAILYGADLSMRAIVKNADDARQVVRRMKRLGAFSVKSYMQPRREQRQWVIQAAREESIMVVPEGGGNLEMNLSMVLDGHTGIEHALPVAPLYQDVVSLFAKSGTGYTPTLLVAYGGLSGEHWFYQHANVWEDEKLLRFTPRPLLDARAIRRQVTAPDWDWHHVDVAAGAKRIVEAGGSVQLGAHGQRQGLGAHWELWALASGGMRPIDALRCATLLGARYIGLDREIGSIESGKLADFLVLDRNPLEKIENTNSIRMVVKNGEVFDGDTMDRLWPIASKRPKFTWER